MHLNRYPVKSGRKSYLYYRLRRKEKTPQGWRDKTVVYLGAKPEINMAKVCAFNLDLEKLSRIPGLTIIGWAGEKLDCGAG